MRFHILSCTQTLQVFSNPELHLRLTLQSFLQRQTLCDDTKLPTGSGYQLLCCVTMTTPVVAGDGVRCTSRDALCFMSKGWTGQEMACSSGDKWSLGVLLLSWLVQICPSWTLQSPVPLVPESSWRNSKGLR